MDPYCGKVAAFLNLLIYVLIRWPHGNRIKTLAINENRKGPLEIVLLILATLGTTLIPIVWITTGFPAVADYALNPVAFAFGIAAIVVGNWLFYRSHADLGVYWSPTLQMRENHQLITSGVYARIRHPMYTAIFIQGIGQVLYLPNWIVGPAWLVTFAILYLFRIGYEERMMLDRFGSEYDTYMQHTGRLLPWPGQKASE